MANSHICSIQDCGKTQYAHGWCNMHYNRWKRNGDPLTRLRPANGEALAFFHARVLNYEGYECFIWPYHRMNNGYAILNLAGAPKLVSRLVCEEENGPPTTPSHEAAHSCGKGHLGCVTKRHLSWKTRKENEADKLLHGTHHRGSQSPRAKLNAGIASRIRELAKTNTHRQVARIVGFSLGTVGRVVRGESWSDD